MPISQAVILVGGKGERLNDKFRFSPAIEVPKCLTEVGGKPFVTYAINSLSLAGVPDIVLVVGYRQEEFEFLRSDVVRLVETAEDVNQVVLNTCKEGRLILLNGDCYPILDWEDFVCNESPRVPVKPNLRDAGIAVVDRQHILSRDIDVQNIFNMMEFYPTCLIQGGLHIGTYQGLERARQYMGIVCFGQ